jgi:hypothetical protein
LAVSRLKASSGKTASGENAGFEMGKLATLDRSMVELFYRSDPKAETVELISGKQ